MGWQEPPGRRSSADALPHPALRGRVLAYTCFREESAIAPVRRETPSGELVLVIGLGGRLLAGPSLRPYGAFVAGLHDRPTRTSYGGFQEGVQVRLDPLGAYALLGVALDDLGNQVVELSDVLPAAGQWAERLAVEPWPGRFALLDRLILTRMTRGPQPSDEVAGAWRELRRTAGTARIADLAAFSGRSHRHLAARFREQVGAPPKRAARVLRYERAARLLSRGLSPAAVAARCGYADQPHLTREFAALAGLTPGQLSSRPGVPA